MLCRKLAIILAVISAGGAPAFAGPDGVTAPQTNPAAAPATNSLPPKIITTDGVVYNATRLSRVEPDGLLVEFQPEAGGTGLAKIKFAKLPQSLQKQFGYDPRKSADYEHQETLAMVAMTQKLQQDEKARSAAATLQNEVLRPNLMGAVVVNSSDPTVTYTYYTPDQKPVALNGGVANCQYDYQCHADFDVRVEQDADGGPIHFYIDKVRISLGLSCHITEPLDPFDLVRLHEEGRRKVFEYFYRLGPQLANRIGESMIGREFASREADFDKAKTGALAEAETQVRNSYIPRLETVAWYADNYYEKLTEGGLSNMDRSQAAQEACDMFSKDLSN